MTNRIARRAVLLSLSSIAAASALSAGLFSRGLPPGLDLALERQSEAGLYAVALSPVAPPISVGQMHTWTVRLADPEGRPIDGAEITVDGGMPQHGHGLPTSPAVTQHLGDGRYLVEGVKFNMRGWWEIELAIDGPAGPDAVTFNIVL